jgi:hypothetical protein
MLHRDLHSAGMALGPMWPCYATLVCISSLGQLVVVFQGPDVTTPSLVGGDVIDHLSMLLFVLCVFFVCSLLVLGLFFAHSLSCVELCCC